MLDGLIGLARGLQGLLGLWSTLYVLVATLFGIVIGALPGLTAPMAVALLAALTVRMPADTAVLVLVSTYVGAIYGASRGAILLGGVEGPAGAAARRDGRVLAGQGQAGRAIGISTTGSVMGTLIGIVFLAALAPAVGDWALRLGVYELFWLAVLGVVIAGSLAGDDPLKGWLAGTLGLALAMVGRDPILGVPRLTFGSADLDGGLALLPALVGLFGVAEVLTALGDRGGRLEVPDHGSYLPRPDDLRRHWRTIVRSGLIGTLVGVVPGLGEDAAARLAYRAARRASRDPEEFGRGSMEGLMAAETGDNACVPGAIVPTLALAVPGSATAAILLAAMLIHGVQPGPLVMANSPRLVYDVVAMTLLATLGILGYGLCLVRPLMRLARVRRELIVPVVLVACVAGMFAMDQRLLDVWTMLGFGVAGLLLRRLGYPLAPLAMGLVLGDLLDRSLRRGLELAAGSPWPFVTRPVSAILAGIALLVVLASLFERPGVPGNREETPQDDNRQGLR